MLGCDNARRDVNQLEQLPTVHSTVFVAVFGRLSGQRCDKYHNRDYVRAKGCRELTSLQRYVTAESETAFCFGTFAGSTAGVRFR